MLATLVIGAAVSLSIVYLLWQWATGALAYRPEELAQWHSASQETGLTKELPRQFDRPQALRIVSVGQRQATAVYSVVNALRRPVRSGLVR